MPSGNITLATSRPHIRASSIAEHAKLVYSEDTAQAPSQTSLKPFRSLRLILQKSPSCLILYRLKWKILNFNFYSKKNAKFINLYQPLDQKGHAIIDVTDDGNCGYYTTMLGMLYLKVKDTPVCSQDYHVKMRSLRKRIIQYMEELKNEIMNMFTLSVNPNCNIKMFEQ